MCGIIGFVANSNKEISESSLKKMADTINYRGPDDEGYLISDYNGFRFGLAQKRLSIIDLSPLGHQPMNFENLSIIFNGEIYNFSEIKQELELSGYTFISKSDTEVILKAFHKWGTECINKFNGMFAIAIFDKKNGELYLIRDRMGVKPLYYYYDGCNLVFASELKPIMAYPYFNKEINKNIIYSYLYHGYIAAPDTIFKSTYKLLPGHYLKWNCGNIHLKKYWSLKDIYISSKIIEKTEEQYLNELDELLISSVKYRMIADVPIGCFLSGGIDSSLVAAVMQKLSPDPIKTFTIGFHEKEYNEADHAKKVSEYLKTDHHEIYLPVKETEKLIHEIPMFYDEPFADSSQIPMMLVSKLAKKNVTVTLSGDAGDELFCGYTRYDEDLKYRKFSLASNLLNKISKFCDLKKILKMINPKLLKIYYFNDDNSIINSGYLYSKNYINKLINGCDFNYSEKYFDLLKKKENIQILHMIQDMEIYLPDDILTKVDRATMSATIESRNPLLDYRIIKYSFTIPHNLKYNMGEKKYLLKKLAYKYIPKKMLERSKKGFAIPVYSWLHNDLHYLVDKYLEKSYIKKQDIFNVDNVVKFKESFEKEKNSGFFSWRMFNLIVFQMWYDVYMK